MTDSVINFIDVETTGLDPLRHEIISVGIVSTQNLEVVSEREIKMLPTDISRADPAALKMNQYSASLWQDAVSQEEGAVSVGELLGECIAGHNVFFDLLFLHETFKRHNINYKMPKHVIDTYALAWLIGHKTGQPRSFSLTKLCEYFAITNSNPHTALSDARASFEVYKNLLKT